MTRPQTRQKRHEQNVQKIEMSAGGEDEVKWDILVEDPFRATATKSMSKKVVEGKKEAPRAPVSVTQRRTVGATQRRCR